MKQSFNQLDWGLLCAQNATILSLTIMRSIMGRNGNDFSERTKLLLAQRVGWLCSKPGCPKPTVGPKKGSDGVVKLGEAAHITAASAGGPRYDASLSSEERRSFSNGIWLCRDHAHQIDHDEEHFTVAMLRQWKRDAEARAFEQLTTGGLARTVNLGPELIEELKELAASLSLPAEDDLLNVKRRLQESVSKHLDAFESLPEWPVHTVKLSLEAQLPHDKSGIFDVDRLGPALQAAGEVSIVAPPGTGKSTTLVQLGRKLNEGGPIPLLIPLAEWAYDGGDIFAWTANRNAFLGIRPEHLKFLAHHGELALLLDGWNELEGEGRKKLLNQLKGLRRDYPLLLVCMSTRQQAREVPVRGPQVRIRPLSEEQQLVVARALKGHVGEKVLDHAWRTTGLRDLTGIPLYLSVLIEVSGDNGLPETKEEILRRFVEKHESVPERAEILDQELHGQHSKILEGLAVEATIAANTTIAEAKAFSVVKTVEDRLVEDGQLSSVHQPKLVLEVLVNTHTLESTASSGVSFQHQQFQEWYASHEVERQMLDAHRTGLGLTDEFAIAVLNNPAWEEAVLFAAERLSRRDNDGVAAVATAITTCLQIDPLFAAAILARSASGVWDKVGEAIQSFARQWHRPGRVDRGLSFMVATGRPEFADDIWPLVTSSDSQVQLPALRTGTRFKISVLGDHLQRSLTSLDEATRERLLSGLAYEGDIYALELVADLAKRDDSTKVQNDVFDALMFRLAERQALELLRSGSNDVWKHVAARGYAREISDPEIAARLRAIEDELLNETARPERTLAALVGLEPVPPDRVTELLATPEFDFKADNAGSSLSRAQERLPSAVGEAMRQRLAKGLPLPWRPDDFLTTVPDQDEGPIAQVVLKDEVDQERRKEAARVVGSRTIRAMVEECIRRWMDIKALDRRPAQGEYERLRSQQDLIAVTRPPAFFKAICSFGDESDADIIAELGRLVARHGGDPNQGELILDAELRTHVVAVMNKWAESLLSSSTATRHHFDEVVRAMKRLPDPAQFVPISRMLNEDLTRWRAAKERWRTNRQRGSIPTDVSHSYTWTYRDALAAIGTEEVKDLLVEYLDDPDFSQEAAVALRQIWDKAVAGGEKDIKPFRSWPDFGLALANLARREANPTATTDAAEAILSAATKIISSDSDTPQLSKAAALAGVAVTMPHGNKKELLEGLVATNIPARAKLDLMTRMVVGGLIVEADSLMKGLHQLFEEAETQSWLMGNDNSEVFKWLKLFPFSDNPLKVLDALESIQAGFRQVRPWHLRGLLQAIGKMPGEGAIEVLSLLAEKEPGLLREYDWYRALVAQWGQGSLELLEAVAAGRFGNADAVKSGGYQLPGEVAALMKETREGEKQLIAHFKEATNDSQKAFLAAVISEFGSTNSFLALVNDPVGRAAAKQQLHSTLMELTYRKDPVSPDGNAYELVPVDATALRRALFKLSVSDQTEIASFAVLCLEMIDELRDEYDGIDTEPRHPDISTGRPWPPIGREGAVLDNNAGTSAIG
ncbi:hypothetical protein [Ciceribacter sp. L1K22]|uniref:NACHT domain-containing protein n=1 Tax=Ciceribacter sp. L1K22 TaxID=2820275 RepID=UPI001ABEC579|nr:hypothetical protein [Ciceribacter sp. L1K22]MBO3758902.1 hypothetical protein [Ciceribacter sp. L1K22]